MDGDNLESQTAIPETTATVGEVENQYGRYQAFRRFDPKTSLALLPDQQGMRGYLAPKYVLADRGLYFVDGAFKKTAKERMRGAPHLWEHQTWSVDDILGVHVDAEEDERGLLVTALLNEDKETARKVMSDYRFGKDYGWSYGWSYGFDIVRDRSGTPEDDKKLDRSGAPHLANTPINDLKAITETRAWEGSTVVWGAIHNAGPDVVQRRRAFLGDPTKTLETLIAALTAGTATPEQLTLAEHLVTAWQTRAAAGSNHGTREQQGELPPTPRRDWEVALVELKKLNLSFAELAA